MQHIYSDKLLVKMDAPLPDLVDEYSLKEWWEELHTQILKDGVDVKENTDYYKKMMWEGDLKKMTPLPCSLVRAVKERTGSLKAALLFPILLDDYFHSTKRGVWYLCDEIEVERLLAALRRVHLVKLKWDEESKAMRVTVDLEGVGAMLGEESTSLNGVFSPSPLV